MVLYHIVAGLGVSDTERQRGKPVFLLVGLYAGLGESAPAKVGRMERMKKEDLYTAAGWVDAARLIDCPEPFVIGLGGRGIGKSYGVLRELYERQIPFIYMRRTQTQIDAVSVQALNPYNQISADIGADIVTDKIGKQTVGFYNGVLNDKGVLVPDGEPFALGIALSTFATIRSLSAERYEVLLFDEIIPERHERPIKEEGLAFSNVLESLNRNRELQDRRPLKVIMLTNSNTINSKIIEAVGCIDIIDNMTRTGQFYKSVDGLIAIFRYIDSPISKRKQDSAIYKVIKNSDFQNMALSNEFSRGDYENVSAKPINEYLPLCSFGNSTICKHKSKREYYCIAGVKAADRYENLPLSRKAFNRKYWYVYGAMMDKKVFYQNAAVKIEIEGAFK